MKIKRKVVQHGQSSLTVSLPARWVRRNNIKKGDEVMMEEYGSFVKISSEKIDYENKASANLCGLKDDTVARLLSGLHKNGYDSVNLICKPGQIQVIQRRVNSMLIGYEIVEITSNGCVVKTISHTDGADFNNLLRRIFLVTIRLGNNLLKMLSEKKFDGFRDLLVLEETNNRLTNYIHRLVNKQFSSQEKLSYLYIITWLQESIADDYRRIAILFSEKRVEGNFVALLDDVNTLLEEFYFLFYNFDFAKLEKLINKSKNLEKKIENAFLKNESRDGVKGLFLLSSVLKNINDSFGSTIAYHN